MAAVSAPLVGENASLVCAMGAPETRQFGSVSDSPGCPGTRYSTGRGTDRDFPLHEAPATRSDRGGHNKASASIRPHPEAEVPDSEPVRRRKQRAEIGPRSVGEDIRRPSAMLIRLQQPMFVVQLVLGSVARGIRILGRGVPPTPEKHLETAFVPRSA